MKNKELAAKIWKAVFDDLYERGGFDPWWDGIDSGTQAEIRETITEIIRKELKGAK